MSCLGPLSFLTVFYIRCDWLLNKMLQIVNGVEMKCQPNTNCEPWVMGHESWAMSPIHCVWVVIQEHQSVILIFCKEWYCSPFTEVSLLSISTVKCFLHVFASGCKLAIFGGRSKGNKGNKKYSKAVSGATVFAGVFDGSTHTMIVWL